MSDLSRGELGIQMLCAWNNIPRDKAPASWSEHHNEWTRDAWARVAEAAIQHHAANSDGGVEPVAWQYGDDWSMPVSVDFAWWSTSRIAEHTARWKCVRPLYTHPPAKALDGIAVTDEMVERACRERYPMWDVAMTPGDQDWHRKYMRAALEAALK